FVLLRGEIALTREGGIPLLLGGGTPGPEAVLSDAKLSADLGDGEAIGGHHAHGLELELTGVGLAGHLGPPRSESTPLTLAPQSLGRFIVLHVVASSGYIAP